MADQQLLDPYALAPNLAPAANDFVWPPPEWVDAAPAAADAPPFAQQPPDLGPPVDPALSWPPPMPEEPPEIQFDLGPQNDLSIPDYGPPDAISGVGYAPGFGPPPMPEIAEIEMPGEDVSDPAAQRVARDEELGAMSPEELAALSPDEFAMYQARRQIAAEDRKVAEEAKVALADRLRAEANLSAHQFAQKRAATKLAEVEQEADRLAREEVDPGRFWADRSIPQKIASVISVIAGGLAAPSMGGRNIGLEMLTKEIDRDIALQQSSLAARRGNVERKKLAIDEMFARNGDAYQSAEAMRAAGYGQAMRQIEAEAAQYDPKGTTAIRLASMYRALEQRRAEALQAYQAQAFEQSRNQIELADKVMGIKLKEADLRKKLGGIGGGGDPALPPEAYQAQGLEPPPFPMNAKQYKTWLDRAEQSNRFAKAKSQMSVEEREQAVFGFDGRPLPQDTGEPFIARGRPEEVSELRNQLSAAKSVVDALDTIRRNRSGFSSDMVGGDEWKRVQQAYADAVLVAKDVFKLGALAGPDEAIIKRYLTGGLDPTGIRSVEAGIEQARRSIQRKVTNDLRARGYRGRIDIPQLAGLQPRAVDEDEQKFRSVLKSPWEGDVYAGKTPAVRASVAPGADPEYIRGYSADQEQYVLELAKKASAGGEAAEEAIGQLRLIAKQADEPGLQEFAKSLLPGADKPKEKPRTMPDERPRFR